MAALTGNDIPETFPKGRNVYDLGSTEQVWGGGLVGLNAAGFMIPWDNVLASTFIGLCLEDALEPTQDVARVNDEGTIIKNIPIASAVQGSVGDEVFCTTDNVKADCALTATSRAIGKIIRFRSASDCDIQLYSAVEFGARYDGA